MTTVPGAGTTGAAARAARVWDEALAAIPDGDAWVQEALAGVDAAGLVKEGVRLMRVARPRLLEHADCDADQAVVDAAAACLVAAGRRALADPVLRRELVGGWVADPSLADVFDLDSGYPAEIVVGRFDGIRHPDGLRLMEFNGGLPGGVMPTDVSAAVMRGWPPFQRLTEALTVEVPDLGAALMATLRETWASYGGTGDPFVVLAFPDEMVAVYRPVLDHVLAVARADGLDLETADPGALVHEAGALRLRGRAVDVLFRGFFTTMLGSLGSRLDGILAAARAGDVCLVTSFRAGLYGHKALFALVTDPAEELDVDPAAREVAVRHLPWTRLLRDVETTDPAGARGRLLDYARDHRASLVLKPADGFGGIGVHLGWTMDADAWAARLGEALAQGGWILQDRLETTTEVLPLLEPGFPVQEFTVDHNPVVCGGRIVGYFSRLSTSGITNITSGGSVVPTFFVG